MKKAVLLFVLGGLLLFGAGCGGGGGSSNDGGGGTTVKTIPVNLSYTVNTSTTTSDTVTMTVVNIEVKSDNTLKVNCTWTAVNNSGCLKIFKQSDKGKTKFYIYDKDHDITYKHTAGEGAAYRDTVLGTTAVSGAYYFPALNSATTSIYFYDDNYGPRLGPVYVSGN